MEAALLAYILLSCHRATKMPAVNSFDAGRCTLLYETLPRLVNSTCKLLHRPGIGSLRL
jgi:hypothetical protein